MNRMVGGTFSVVVCVDWVGHMGLVIRHVKIFSIPARREEDLGSKAVRAIHAWEARGLRVSALLVVVKTIVADGLRCEIVARSSLEGIAGNHSKTFGESLQLIVVRTWPLQIVNQTSTDLVNLLERAILMLIEQNWSPVVGEITMDGAGSAG